MGIRLRNRRNVVRAIIILIIMIFIGVKGIQFLNNSASKGKDDSKTANNRTEQEILKGKSLEVKENGDISLDESNYFIRYSIAVTEGKDYEGYHQDKDYIYLNMKNSSKVSLNTKSFKEPSKDIILADINGKPTLTIKKTYTDNNFVFFDEVIGSIVILISKEVQPFKHSVVLDPGHGGVDPGAPAYDNSFEEKDITLKIQKDLRQELIFKGCKVAMSREDDKTIRIEDVVAFTEKQKPDVFVSVHINSYEKSKTYNGIETYYSKENIKLAESKKLAEKIQSNAVKSDDWKNRGVVTANFFVIKHNTMPAVLIECGFASNPEDVARLKDNNCLRNLSKNISQGILQYLDAQ